MSDELDQILISWNQPNSGEEMHQLQTALMDMAMFEPESDNGKSVLDIVCRVGLEGDHALVDYTKRFDGVGITVGRLRVAKEDMEKAHRNIDRDLLKSLRQAIKNVKEYQSEIFIGDRVHPGIRYTPLRRVGVCVPGASAPLPSTVIMTVVPAQVAGVGEIAVVSPPRYKGDIHPVILAVCHELGIEEVYRIGGAQAVAALAVGTNTVRKVDKIVGPGNKWVQTAKKMVSGLVVGYDSVAGPSEVLILANDRANPAWVAADMLSQAEHDPGCAVLFTDSKVLAEKTLHQLNKQVKQLHRAEETSKCLREFSRIVVFESMDEAVEWANYFASEHLQIQCGDKSREIAEKVENAGAIFIGEFSPVATGDYWAGPSHTLPTGTSARFSSALTSNDFVKSISIIEYSKEQLAASAEDIIRLAEAEGLDAHAKSVRIRQQS